MDENKLSEVLHLYWSQIIPITVTVGTQSTAACTDLVFQLNLSSPSNSAYKSTTVTKTIFTENTFLASE